MEERTRLYTQRQALSEPLTRLPCLCSNIRIPLRNRNNSYKVIFILLFVLFIARCGPFSRSMQAYTFYL